MVKYQTVRQLKIEEFKTPFFKEFITWHPKIGLSKVVPWEKFAAIYMSVMNLENGNQKDND